MTEAVTVTAAQGQLLKTDRADVAVTFEAKQLTELPVLDRNFTKFILLTPGTQRLGWNHATSENPQGSIQTQVNGQTLQRHGLPARRDRESRSDPGHHRHQPHPGVHRRVQDHLPELRRRVRPGHRGRGVGADQVRDERDPRQRLRVPSERQVPGPEPLLAAGRREPDHRPRPAGDEARPVRRLDRRPHPEGEVLLLRRLPGMALHGRRLQAADGAHGPGPDGEPQRVRRQHLRPPHRRSQPSARSSRATSSPRIGSRPRP